MVVLSDIIGDNKVEKVVTGFQFTEGPVWVPEGFLLFSDIPRLKKAINPMREAFDMPLILMRHLY